MHSRIFQVSKEPIKKEDYISKRYFDDHWFVRTIADYVSDYTDIVRDIEWLKEATKDRGFEFGEDENGMYFVITDKIKYFEGRAEEIRLHASKLINVTAEEVADGGIGLAVYMLKEAYDDEHSFYIICDDWMNSLDHFTRSNKEGDKFYFGATFDYHF